MMGSGSFKYSSWCTVLLISGFVFACSGGKSNHHAPPDNDLDAGGGGGGGTGGSAGVAGSISNNGGQSGAASLVDAGADASPSDASEPTVDAQADAAPIVLPIPVCSHTITWAAGTALAELGSAAPQELLSVTPDELSIVWLETDPNNDVKAFVADRTTTTAAFSTPNEIAAVAGYDFKQGIAISTDGLSVVIIGEGGGELASLHRTARGGEFDATADDTQFQGLNITTSFFGGQFVAPKLINGDQSLYFTHYVSSEVGDASVVSSSNVSSTQIENGSWNSTLTDLESPALLGMDGNRLLITGISSDELTLFYWDEGAAKEYVVWRGSSALPFENPTELSNFRGASPNQGCTRLYFTNGGVLSSAAAQ